CVYWMFEQMPAKFFSRVLPPTSSTLFPYTTLFRSHHHNDGADIRKGRRRPADGGIRHECRQRARRARRDGKEAGAAKGGDSQREDRKSTRLNYSHVKISYAVFSLKKNNN